MRTAYFIEPNTDTCATPFTIETRCPSSASAYSTTCESGSAGDVTGRKRVGESAGLTLRNVGGVGMLGGDWFVAAVIAACTSCAAASMLRLRSNCSVICVLPNELVEVIESSPAIVVNCFSRGVATAEAIVPGLAPDKFAETLIVGKSTLGRSLTARLR